MYVLNGVGCCGQSSSGGLGWWQLVPTVITAYQQVSGERCWTGYNRKSEIPCPDTPSYDAVARAIQRAPESEVQKVINFLLSANFGRGPKSRAELLEPGCLPKWVKAILGGADCRASKFPEAPVHFRNLVRTYGAPETPAENLPGSSLSSTGAQTGGALLAAGLALFFLPKLIGK